MKLKPILIISLLAAFGFAEYRVFELQIYKETLNPSAEQEEPSVLRQPDDITNANDLQRAPQSEAQIEIVKTIISNLDPEQYQGYYPLENGEKIKYTSTWMCKGRTNGKEYCPNPRLKTEEEPQDSLKGN